MFLCKWFKNAFLECLCHSDPGISADKFQCGHCCLFRWDFPTADIDISVFFVIFHRIRQNIHQNPFHMHRTSNKIPVCNFFLFPNDPDILLRSHMFDHTQYFLKNTVQIKWDVFQNHFIWLQLAHVQNLVYQFQQQMGCLFDLCPAFRLFLHIVCIMVCHIDHAADSIDRCPDIMAHSLQKLSFCLIGCFCFFCCS